MALVIGVAVHFRLEHVVFSTPYIYRVSNRHTDHSTHSLNTRDTTHTTDTMSLHPEVEDWLGKYPEPQGIAPIVQKEQVLEWLQSGDNKEMIIDLRKHDFKGGKIKGALCLHYTGVYNSIEDIYQLCKSAGKTKIIIHCWSSRQRAVKTAGWFFDILKAHNDDSIEVFVLEGGIKGWVEGGKKYTDLMIEFEPTAFC